MTDDERRKALAGKLREYCAWARPQYYGEHGPNERHDAPDDGEVLEGLLEMMAELAELLEAPRVGICTCCGGSGWVDVQEGGYTEEKPCSMCDDGMVNR